MASRTRPISGPSSLSLLMFTSGIDVESLTDTSIIVLQCVGLFLSADW